MRHECEEQRHSQSSKQSKYYTIQIANNEAGPAWAKKEEGGNCKEEGLVGGREAKTEGNEDVRKGRLRRATIDDLNAIMNINDNVYLGLDHLPELFYVYMQSKLHVLYVYDDWYR